MEDLGVPVFGVDGFHGVGYRAPIFTDVHEGRQHKTDGEAENLAGWKRRTCVGNGCVRVHGTVASTVVGEHGKEN